MTRFKVNIKLLLVKIHYFLFNGALSSVIPFLQVYAAQLGISVIAIGIIYSVLPFLILIARPLFGAIADFTQKLKLILMIQLCIIITTMLGICFIPVPQNLEDTLPSNYSDAELLCWRNSSYLLSFEPKNCMLELFNSSSKCSALCSLCNAKSSLCLNNYRNYSRQNGIDDDGPPFTVVLNSTAEFLTRCVNDLSENCDESCYIDPRKNCRELDKVSNPPLQLWLFSILIALTWMAFGVSASLSDSACYNTLQSKPELFGKQRLWGTVGWGSIAIFAGYMNQISTGSSTIYDYSPGFYILAILITIDLIVVKNLNVTGAKTSTNLCKDVGMLLMKPQVVMFLFGVFSVGMFTGLYRSYLYLYLRDLNASTLVLGLASGVQCFLGELPFFFFSGWAIRKVGQINIITVSFISYGLRFLAYSYLANPWWVLPIEILQGPCFGAFYAAMTSYANSIAPSGTEATMQGLVGGAYEGLGSAMGSVLGGFGFGIYGGRFTFFWFGVIAFLGAMFHAGAHAFVKLVNRN